MEDHFVELWNRRHSREEDMRVAGPEERTASSGRVRTDGERMVATRGRRWTLTLIGRTGSATLPVLLERVLGAALAPAPGEGRC